MYNIPLMCWPAEWACCIIIALLTTIDPGHVSPCLRIMTHIITLLAHIKHQLSQVNISLRIYFIKHLNSSNGHLYAFKKRDHYSYKNSCRQAFWPICWNSSTLNTLRRRIFFLFFTWFWGHKKHRYHYSG